MDPTPLPTGTVTFLLTDIEGSTRLWERHPEAMRLALARHDALLAEGIQQQGGVVVKSRGEGDSFFAVFAHPGTALAAACALQQALLAEPWPAQTPLRVRMALHTDTADLREGDYFGPGVNRCARLRAVAHGGQVVLSQATCQRVEDQLPEDVSLRDLGTHRLKDLQQPEHLYQLLHPSLPIDFPPLRSLEAFAHNLPVQLTSFIGREEAMAAVKRLLTTTHLLTLTGAGGCGKTRLALQVAADLVEAYADGVWLVELAALADPALVPQAVASALGVREEPGRPLTATLTDHLRSRSLLLVLDNCEHLLMACAQLVESLLRACPALRVLASSREGLGIAGELTYRVPSLSLPDPRQLLPPERLAEYEAARLFIERTRFSQPGFALTDRNAPAVAQVCHRLDGIPLAIELAAARVKALPVEKIAERLDDRFRLLTGGSRTALPRQQTLRALIDWSYDLLLEAERVLLRRLSVFAGGWTLEAAEAVVSGQWSVVSESETPTQLTTDHWPLTSESVLDLLTTLVEKSLVMYEERAGEARYWLLETVRQYARDRLLESGETVSVRGRHRDFFLRLAEVAGAKLLGTEYAAWLERLDTEDDNLRAALEWSLKTGEAEAGIRLASALEDYWQTRGYRSEGRKRLAELLSLPEALRWTPARAKALITAGQLATDQGDYEPARALLEESLAIQRELGDQAGVAICLIRLGLVAREQGDYETARSLYEQSLVVRRQLGDQDGIGESLYGLGYVAYLQHDGATAQALLEEGLAIYRQREHKHHIGWILAHLGEVADARGDYRAAHAHLEESLTIWRELGMEQGIAHSLHKQGLVERHQGDWGAARSRFAESLTLSQPTDNKRGIAECLGGLAEVAAAQGQPERAARLFGAAEALREAIGASMGPADRAEYDRIVVTARAALGEKAFASAWAEGRALSLEEAVRAALAEEPPPSSTPP